MEAFLFLWGMSYFKLFVIFWIALAFQSCRGKEYLHSISSYDIIRSNLIAYHKDSMLVVGYTEFNGRDSIVHRLNKRLLDGYSMDGKTLCLSIVHTNPIRKHYKYYVQNKDSVWVFDSQRRFLYDKRVQYE